jgi:hypothetical protein
MCSRPVAWIAWSWLDPLIGGAGDDEPIDNIIGCEVQRAFGVACSERVDDGLQLVAPDRAQHVVGDAKRARVAPGLLCAWTARAAVKTPE